MRGTAFPGWAPFWFKTTHTWALVDGPVTWGRVCRAYMQTRGVTLDDVYGLRCAALDLADPLPNFGDRGEHAKGNTTLGAFFDVNRMTKGLAPSLGTPPPKTGRPWKGIP